MKKHRKKKKNMTQADEEIKQEETAKEETSSETEETPESEEKPEAEKAEGTVEDAKPEAPQDKDAAKVKELTDRLQRLMAEFDNYRKRTEKEKATTYDAGISKVLEKMLPVVDNFERGLQAVPEAERSSSSYTGMDMIYKQLMKVMTDLGVEPIEAAGKAFDPNFHHAVMQVASEDLEPNTVAQELQKGYLYKGSVLRCAMVSVVQDN